MPLEVTSMFGETIGVAHGDRCVALTVPVGKSGVVLSPDAARELGVMLHEQADAADTVTHDHED